MEIEQVTGSDIKTFLMVMLLIIGTMLVVLQFINAIRTEKAHHDKPTQTLKEQIASHETWLQADKRRIEALEAAQNEMKAHNAQQDRLSNINVRAQLAMLRHMQHGNNMDGMKESEKEITDYLTGKGE